MRNIIVVLCLLVAGLISSCSNSEPCPPEKVEQEECAKEKWLVLYKDKNEALFNSSENKIDPFQEIKQLLLDGDIRLWESRRRNQEEWLISPLPSSVHDSIGILGNTIYYNKYFDYQSKGKETIKNNHGDDSLYTDSDGMQSYIYPMPEYSPVTFDKISEFRIKEILIHDSLSNENIMKPSLIGFDIYMVNHNILFWVKIDDLKDHIKINKDWVEKIADRKYDGFVYKQYSCKDPQYEWRKVYH